MKVIAIMFSLLLASTSTAAPVDFSMTGLNGKNYKLSDYRGKWVVVNYWATWCPPCAEEIPELNRYHKKHHNKDAMVLGVNFEHQDLDYVRDFMKEFDVSYPVLITRDSITTPFGQLVGLPTTYLVNPEGELVISHMGAVSVEMLESWMKQKDSTDVN